jgi:hypothetical protein
MAQKVAVLRTKEMGEAASHIISELDNHLENLKGDYLIQIIKRMKKHSSHFVMCKNNLCPLTLDFTKNHLLEIVEEMMKTFSTLLK